MAPLFLGLFRQGGQFAQLNLEGSFAWTVFNFFHVPIMAIPNPDAKQKVRILALADRP